MNDELRAKAEAAVPFATLWENWYERVNPAAKSDQLGIGFSDLLRTQFQMLDAIVVNHLTCSERLCPTKQTIRRILEATP